MKKSTIELWVGMFLIAGLACFGYLSVRLAKSEFFGGNGYELHAQFSNCGSLKIGASVMITGVEVGIRTREDALLTGSARGGLRDDALAPP